LWGYGKIVGEMRNFLLRSLHYEELIGHVNSLAELLAVVRRSAIGLPLPAFLSFATAATFFLRSFLLAASP